MNGWINNYDGHNWSEGDEHSRSGDVAFGSGGAGGACGSASISGSAITMIFWPTQGAGTAESPYLISNADEWNTFAGRVNSGYNYSGKFIKLTDDISVTVMVGSSETYSFRGTFLGNNKTLTFTIGECLQ